LELGFGNGKAPAFEIAEPGFHAPAQAVVEHTPLGGRLGQGDDPGLLVAFLVENADMVLTPLLFRSASSTAVIPAFAASPVVISPPS
jgi:hypothetical protein